MLWSFSIGRIAGTELRIHLTFFLLLAWIGASAWAEGGLPAAVENVVFVAALFACVVAHEFGHALAARRYGIATPDITLFPIGGMARLERMPERPRQEIVVALAGPAVSIAIWAIISALGGVPDVAQFERIEQTDIGFWERLGAVNLFLALFNLLPAFPMDGGRVFRALLALRVGRPRATRIAVGAGQVLAAGLGLVGLLGGSPVLVLIAVFIVLAGGAEGSEVALRDIARHMSARDAMITHFETLGPEDGIEAASAALIRTTQHEFPVVDSQARPVGLISRNAIFAATTGPDHPAGLRVGSVMSEVFPSVDVRAPLDPVLDLMHSKGAEAVGVIEPGGRLVGYITRENIGEMMVLAGRGRRG
jgi:Zn-dependent protease/predicted transcriptional regulator